MLREWLAKIGLPIPAGTAIQSRRGKGIEWTDTMTLRSATWLFGVLTLTAFCPGIAGAANVVNTFNDWTLYSNSEGARICFLATRPAATEPAGLQRDPAVLYVSAWPKEGVKSEVSVKLGLPIKKGNDPVLTITGTAISGEAKFKLFVKDDRAFVADATAELKLLEAMKKGSKLTVQAVSERGVVVDTYSLQGLSAALQALGAGCP